MKKRDQIAHLENELAIARKEMGAQAQLTAKTTSRLADAERRILSLELALSVLEKVKAVPSPHYPRVVVQRPLIGTTVWPKDGGALQIYDGPVRVYTSPEAANAGEGILLPEWQQTGNDAFVPDL